MRQWGNRECFTSRFAGAAAASLCYPAGMRGPAIVVVFVVGCITRTEEPWNPEPGFGGGSGSSRPLGCSDTTCGANLVCARNRACYAPDQIRTVHAVWTVRGQTPTLQACAAVTDLAIGFGASFGSPLSLRYSPVPCVEGMFTIDKLPVSYDHVELG